jgi:hypothetical protein
MPRKTLQLPDTHQLRDQHKEHDLLLARLAELDVRMAALALIRQAMSLDAQHSHARLKEARAALFDAGVSAASGLMQKVVVYDAASDARTALLRGEETYTLRLVVTHDDSAGVDWVLTDPFGGEQRAIRGPILVEVPCTPSPA